MDEQIWYSLTESAQKWVHCIGFKRWGIKRLNWTKSNLKRPKICVSNDWDHLGGLSGGDVLNCLNLDHDTRVHHTIYDGVPRWHLEDHSVSPRLSCMTSGQFTRVQHMI